MLLLYIASAVCARWADVLALGMEWVQAAPRAEISMMSSHWKQQGSAGAAGLIESSRLLP